MIKIGAVTIGQSPRVDVTADILPMFGKDALLIEAGALDGLTKDEILAMKPKEDDYILVSRLNDGSFAKFGNTFIMERLQKCITHLEEEGVSLIMMLCGGSFYDAFKSKVPIIYPSKIMNGIAAAVSANSSIVVITPDKEQIQQAYDQWGSVVKKVVPIPANPYGDIAEVIKAAEQAKDIDCDLIVMDCIGFSLKAKEIVRSITNKPVILCRTILTRVVCELLNIAND